MNNSITYTIYVTKFPIQKVRKSIVIKEGDKILKTLDDTKYLTTRQRNLLYRIRGIQKGLKGKQTAEITIPRRSLKGGHVFELIQTTKPTDIQYILNQEDTNKQFELVYQYYKELNK